MTDKKKTTLFSVIYNRFLGKITEDMYMEITPEETIKDLQNLLIDAIPGFEFPRVNLNSYELKTETLDERDVTSDDFIIAVLWNELPEGGAPEAHDVVVERSFFNTPLSSEEINILALLMKQSWLQRQLYSVEVTRMKYSGADFKMTSQANHLKQLNELLKENRRESINKQRLYKRRKVSNDGHYISNWSSLMEVRAID